ncbi:unnamed protein product [Brassica oleracea]|uniref:(rape) hypothetical protein n=1 Tax=Brassica napus TaxID=3708 RepID=A0A816QG74_BRANA|nr:unnamed protein product [Brassica napus]
MRWKEFPSPADPEINCFVDDKEEKKGRSRRRVLLMLLHGDDELLITDMPKEEVESLFDSYEDSDFSRIESTAVEKVELKRGLLEQFTHEMESLLGKQALLIKTLLRKMCTKIKVFPFRIRAELSMTQCRESLTKCKLFSFSDNQ